VGAVKYSNLNGACRTYLALEYRTVDVAGCEDKGVGSETEECIVDDERRAALKIDEISH
jgi:hypothetical protein